MANDFSYFFQLIYRLVQWIIVSSFCWDFSFSVLLNAIIISVACIPFCVVFPLFLRPAAFLWPWWDQVPKELNFWMKTSTLGWTLHLFLPLQLDQKFMLCQYSFWCSLETTRHMNTHALHWSNETCGRNIDLILSMRWAKRRMLMQTWGNSELNNFSAVGQAQYSAYNSGHFKKIIMTVFSTRTPFSK